MTEWRDRIVRDPKMMFGKPTIAGTRITVELILDLLASGESVAAVVEAYPQLQHEDILAALAYASDALSTDELVMAR